MKSVARLFCGGLFVEVVVNDRGEVAVKTADGGWGWVMPVGINEVVALGPYTTHAPVDDSTREDH